MPLVGRVETGQQALKIAPMIAMDEMAQLVVQPELLVDRILREREPHEAADAVQQCRKAIAASLSEMESAIAKTKAKAGDLTQQMHEKVMAQIDWFDNALSRADRQRVETVESQVRRLCNAFAPDRKPQERYYTITSFLFEHGIELVPRLIDAYRL